MTGRLGKWSHSTVGPDEWSQLHKSTSVHISMHMKRCFCHIPAFLYFPLLPLIQFLHTHTHTMVGDSCSRDYDTAACGILWADMLTPVYTICRRREKGKYNRVADEDVRPATGQKRTLMSLGRVRPVLRDTLKRSLSCSRRHQTASERSRSGDTGLKCTADPEQPVLEPPTVLGYDMFTCFVDLECVFISDASAEAMHPNGTIVK